MAYKVDVAVKIYLQLGLVVYSYNLSNAQEVEAREL